MKIIQHEEYILKLGQNAKENWEMLDDAAPDHIFFHLTMFPSGYVILECNGEPTPTMIREGAEICKESTRYRNLKNLKVDYCRCDNLEKGKEVGIVLFKSNRKVGEIKV